MNRVTFDTASEELAWFARQDPAGEYARDGQVLWPNATICRPTSLRLEL